MQISKTVTMFSFVIRVVSSDVCIQNGPISGGTLHCFVSIDILQHTAIVTRLLDGQNHIPHHVNRTADIVNCSNLAP